jgi:hypothetical protein
MQIQGRIVIGDSSIIIKLAISKSIPYNNKITSILAQIHKEIYKLQKVSFYEVLRVHNYHDDSLANEATTLKIRVLRKNGGWHYQPIP